MRKAERVAGLARRDHGLRRAARALRVRRGGIDPEPQRDADRSRPRAQQRDGAVDTAAHRHRYAIGIGLRPKELAERIGKRIGRERLPGHRRRLQQRQACEWALQPFRVGVNDPFSLDGEPNKRDVAVTRRIPDDLNHRTRLPPAPQGESPFPIPKAFACERRRKAGRASPESR